MTTTNEPQRIFPVNRQKDEEYGAYEGTGPFYATAPDSVKEPILSKTGQASSKPLLVQDVFEAAIAKHGDDPALVVERGGKDVTWTWKQYSRDVVASAKSLIALGFEQNETINVIGFNAPEWFFANMGAIYAGGKIAGIYSTNNPKACKYIAGHSKARVVFVEDQAQLKKFLQIRDELPSLAALVVYNDAVPTEANVEGKCPVMTFAQFLEKGASIGDDVIAARRAKQHPGSCCTLIYTSGTTGDPKAVMLSHDALTWTPRSTLLSVIPQDLVFGSENRLISYLPLSHVAAQMCDIHCPMFLANSAVNCTVYFARPDALKGTLKDTLNKVHPTIFFGVPRVWEKFAEAIQEKGKQTTGIAKSISTWAKEVGLSAFKSHQTGATSSANPISFFFADTLVFGKVKGALGLDQCKYAFTGAAPISPDTVDYFGSLGLEVYELYGMSESCGPQTASASSNFRVGWCGSSLLGIETMLEHVPGRDRPAHDNLSAEGEICFRGRHIMMGYMDNDAKTAEAIDPQGWLHSGDIGAFDTKFGLLKITGRIKELIIGAGGENIAPVPIEYDVRHHAPLLSNCMMVGDKRKFNILLVTLKQAVTADGLFLNELLPQEIDPECKTVEQAQSSAKYHAYIEAAIAKANAAAVSQAAKIQKFAILPIDFSIPGGELTPTLKLKRAEVNKMYAPLIDRVYEDDYRPAAYGDFAAIYSAIASPAASVAQLSSSSPAASAAAPAPAPAVTLEAATAAPAPEAATAAPAPEAATAAPAPEAATTAQ